MGIRSGLSVLVMTAAMTPAVLAQSPGADTYKANCAVCHGSDGMAATDAGKSLKTPPFSDATTARMSDAELTEITKNGKGKMPGYSGKLTDAQIKEVVAYIRTMQNK